MKLIRVFIGVLLVNALLVAGSLAETPELPPDILKFVTNERINVYAVGPDRVADVTGYLVDQNGKASITPGGLSNPTIKIFITNRVSRHLEESDQPLTVMKRALSSGEMKIQGVGVKKGIKVSAFIEGLKRLAPEGSPSKPKIGAADTSIVKPLTSISTRTDKGSFTIGESSGLRYNSIEFSAKKITEGETIVLNEYSGLGFNEIPLGTEGLAFTGREEPLGRFLEVKLPPNIDWSVMSFSYDEKELYSRNINEDTIKVKWYDESRGFWVELKKGTPSWVKDVRVDMERNIISVNVSHNSVYGIGGFVATQNIPSSITVRSGPMVEAESGTDAQIEAAETVSTEAPNWILYLSIALVLLFLLLAGAILMRRRKRKEGPKRKQDAEVLEAEQVEQ